MPIDPKSITWDAPDPKGITWDDEPKKAAKPDRVQMLKDELLTSLPGGFLRGVKDIIDTGAGFVSKLGGQDEAARVQAENDAGKADFAAAQRRAGAGGSSVARVGGQIAGAMPAVSALGAGTVAAGLPRLGTAIASSGMRVGAPASALANLGIRSAGGAVAGGLSAGLVDPERAATGAAIGAALPGAVSVAGAAGRTIGRGARALVEPLYEGGRQAIVGRALNRAAGAEAQQVATRLREASAPFVGPSQGAIPRTTMGEYVPGSLPSVGQAAENPAIAALERAATATNPEATNALAARAAAQNAARVGVLDDMAGTQGARDFFAADRASTAQALYDQAYEKGINLSKNAATGQFQSKAQIAGTKGEITKLLQRPSIQEAMKEARKLAADEGVKLTDPAGSVKGLDYVKRALDDKISKATGNEQRILVELKNRLLTTIDRLSPDYAAARATFADMSRPINQMDIAGAIRDKSVNALTGNLQPAAFARNLTDDTARAATGFRGATLEGVMSPAQMNQLNSVFLDVQRSNAAQTVGRGVGSDTVQKLAYTNMLDQAGVPTFLRAMPAGQVVGNALSRAGDVVYGRANREIAEQLAQIMMDPGAASRAMEMAQRGVPPSRIVQLLSNPLLQQAGYRSAPVLTAQ